MDHPNIIKLIDVYEDERFLHLVTDLCTGGELFERIIAKTKSAEGHYSESDASVVVRCLLSAMEYCHTVHNISHRDLKPGTNGDHRTVIITYEAINYKTCPFLLYIYIG